MAPFLMAHGVVTICLKIPVLTYSEISMMMSWWWWLVDGNTWISSVTLVYVAVLLLTSHPYSSILNARW